VLLYNQQLPQSALGSKTPLQAIKVSHKLKPDIFKKGNHTNFRDVTLSQYAGAFDALQGDYFFRSTAAAIPCGAVTVPTSWMAAWIVSSSAAVWAMT
jgi:hypothetical protein